MFFALLVALDGALAAAALIFWLKSRKSGSQAHEISMLAELRLTAISEQIRTLNGLLDAERAAAEEWKRRSESLRERIQSILDERDWWNRYYHEQSSEHTAAQALLFREIQRLGTILRASGKQVALSTTLVKVVHEFEEKHPKQAEIGLRARHDAVAPTPLPPTTAADPVVSVKP